MTRGATAIVAETARSVVTLELDPERAAAARDGLAGLANVEALEGDAYALLRGRGPSGLVFADAGGDRRRQAPLSTAGDVRPAGPAAVPSRLIVVRALRGAAVTMAAIAECSAQKPVPEAVSMSTPRWTFPAAVTRQAPTPPKRRSPGPRRGLITAAARPIRYRSLTASLLICRARYDPVRRGCLGPSSNVGCPAQAPPTRSAAASESGTSAKPSSE